MWIKSSEAVPVRKKGDGVFLSHSSKDKQFVRWLGTQLQKKGHFVWIDEAEIRAGESLIDKISEGLGSVEYVVAILSKASIKSEWVKRELNVALTREIKRKKYQVIPILIEKVAVPAFLEDRKYLDFQSLSKAKKSLKELLVRLGPVKKHIKIPSEELSQIKDLLKDLKKENALLSKEIDERMHFLHMTRSENLKIALEKENKEHPEYAHINSAYAFDLEGIPITLGYLLWAVAKSQRRGGHPIEGLLTINGLWPVVRRMLAAYIKSNNNA